MSNVVRLPERPGIAFRYKRGNIGLALLEGLRHETTAHDIEQVFYDLLFVNDHQANDAAREVIADLLQSMEPKE